jgi:hypothetical protein
MASHRSPKIDGGQVGLHFVAIAALTAISTVLITLVLLDQICFASELKSTTSSLSNGTVNASTTTPVFSPVVNYDSGGIGAISVAVSDVNLDGKPDLVVANHNIGDAPGSSVSVLLGNGDGTFERH